jgi:hypothetical protein
MKNKHLDKKFPLKNSKHGLLELFKENTIRLKIFLE